MIAVPQFDGSFNYLKANSCNKVFKSLTVLRLHTWVIPPGSLRSAICDKVLILTQSIISQDYPQGWVKCDFEHFFVKPNQKIMKKFLSLFAFLSLAAVASNAQGISGGLKLGLNLANQTMSSGSYTVSPSFRPTIHAGGYVTVMLGERFGVQPEVLYSGQGAKNGSYVNKFNYITVPVLLRYNFTDLFSIHAGPQIGVLMSAKADLGSGEEDVKDQLKSTDIGIAAGLGIDLPMGLNFGFRFVKGMTNIIKEDDDVKYKNYALQLSVGYKLFGK